ncbi:hypothetical protein FZEAL_106 [Fusarium zealandicum]|uniref:Glycosyl hydrolase n=1 Tax=Fusarium zealandicum TaxID=1053134 RepID=A0A8H4XQ33_9HYPO|nr:hypothetical protein FZEAL_106 [Fusarium zealandicum]
MVRLIATAGLASLIATIPLTSAAPSREGTQQYCSVIYTEPPTHCRPIPGTFLAFSSKVSKPDHSGSRPLEDAVGALVVLQDQYFQPDYATWPSAIDWTGAFAGTVVAGMLTTLSKAIDTVDLDGINDWRVKENLISSFYAQLVGSYFGQDVLSIRGQAYDDILWVALGWIEAIKFVRTHSTLHYPGAHAHDPSSSGGLKDIIDSMPWQGYNWFSSFAHRSRIFWNLGSRGWETRFCNGGMVWNPRLNPYKNAITNELWVSASISMYEHFPGDNFTAPWLANAAFPDNDPAHLEAAMQGYKWLKDVNMTNDRGLFVDGYHIDRSKPGNTKCDVRDEMVYTYNQGVLLTGQRGLWAVSGSVSYLEDGHLLIQSVIEATGWNLKNNRPVDDLSHVPRGRLPPWHGLGRGGIMEEQCDASGTCSQDGQTFKGVFFHHFTTFCAPLDSLRVEKGMAMDVHGYRRVQAAHATACRSYLGWVKHNALAALDTRDEAGRFGMWWGAGLFDAIVTLDNDGIDHNAENTTDYRNQGTPDDDTWGGRHRWLPGTGHWTVLEPESDQQVLGSIHEARAQGSEARSQRQDPNELFDIDSNGKYATSHESSLQVVMVDLSTALASELRLLTCHSCGLPTRVRGEQLAVLIGLSIRSGGQFGINDAAKPDRGGHSRWEQARQRGCAFARTSNGELVLGMASNEEHGRARYKKASFIVRYKPSISEEKHQTTAQEPLFFTSSFTLQHSSTKSDISLRTSHSSNKPETLYASPISIMGLIGLVIRSLTSNPDKAHYHTTQTTGGCCRQRAQPAYVVQPQPLALNANYMYTPTGRPSCHQRKMERRAQRKMQRDERCMLRAERRAGRRGAGVTLAKTGMQKVGITGGQTRDAHQDGYETGMINQQQRMVQGTRGLDEEIAPLKEDAPPAYHEVEKK